MATGAPVVFLKNTRKNFGGVGFLAMRGDLGLADDGRVLLNIFLKAAATAAPIMTTPIAGHDFRRKW